MYLRAAQNYTKSALKSGPLGPLRFKSKKKGHAPRYLDFFLCMEHSMDVLNYAVFHIYLGGGGNVRIYSCTLLPTLKVVLRNSPPKNVISESACFAKRKKLCSFSKIYLRTSCYRTH